MHGRTMHAVRTELSSIYVKTITWTIVRIQTTEPMETKLCTCNHVRESAFIHAMVGFDHVIGGVRQIGDLSTLNYVALLQFS
jgi:hypothetical protein